MMQGYPLSANLPEEIGLGERFWYWRGASGQSYIHSIYARDLCPAVPGAVFVIVNRSHGGRRAISAGRFQTNGLLPQDERARAAASDEEIHVHLLARDHDTAEGILRDLRSAMDIAVRPVSEPRVYVKPVQLELLAA
ncbi:hypothetical protein [Aestuariivirga sp.]|uniref:hypothetical protein n=1 Tax=Aestuariivirga sp. TaxID=2650926 RepID=UPI00391C1496